ncbi:MAG: methyl-accepting chemotaxis protein [Gallionellaceae bacterium]
MKSLTLKILLPTLAALLIGMTLLGIALYVQMGGSATKQMESSQEVTASFVAQVSASYITNYDLPSLSGFIKELTKNGDIVYAEFLSAEDTSLTPDVSKAPEDSAHLLMLDKEIKDESGVLIGHFKMAVKRDAIADAQRSAALTVITGVVIVLLAVLASIIFVVRRAVSPAKEMQNVLAEVAQGNLAIKAQADSSDEIGEMARSLNRTVEALNQTLSKVDTHALNVNRAAEAISESVAQQAATSTEMSSSVTEITSTMEELSASSTQIADHSKSVVDIANLTLDSSRKGSEAMQSVLSRMTDIRADNQHSLQEIVELGNKSKQISKVMEIINTVADQTKLIAFNAALEASSAGESGKRFSVVASEIRRLADSVTDSTNEIETKINEIQDSISRLVINSEKGASGIAAGTVASANAAERLNEIVQSASQTTSAAQQISLSTQQQKTASNQVVVALREIVSASSHTAQSITRISQISQEMSGLSSGLENLVSQFKLGNKK